jgi:DNA-binding response OmpR family regulator
MAKLLIVDDETYIRMLYKKEFESEGYQVVVASNPQEAVQAMGAARPDLVILDIELGDENGLDLLNRLRQRYRDCPIILNSAYSTYKSDFQSWLADAYIMKSSDLNPLKHKVKALLGERTCENQW